MKVDTMHVLKFSAKVGTLAGALLVAYAAHAAVTNPLAYQIALTAAGAEKISATPEAINPAVKSAVKQLIVTEAPKPDAVIVAIDGALEACYPANGGKTQDGWSCPGSQQSYLALMQLRGMVLSLLESPEPASIGDSGPTAFGDVAGTYASGANYSSL